MPTARLLTAVAEVLAPRSCFVCGRRGHDVWCDACEVVVDGLTWSGGAPVVPGLETVVVRYRYREQVADVVLAGKLGGRHVVWRDLGRRLLLPEGAEVLQAVPTEPRRRRRRGFDHTARLVAGLAAVSGMPVVDVVAATSGSVDRGQGNATAPAARERPVPHGAWRMTGRLDGRHVVVVDDVLTTGATLAGVARACREAGARSVSATVLAATPR